MSSNKDVWDFNCPQFVDFSEDLNNSGKNDIYFDCKASPEVNSVLKNLQSPGMKPKICLTKDAENELIGRMNAALTVIDKTPKLALLKKHENTNKKNAYCKVAEQAEKNISTLVADQSKSVAILNNIEANKQDRVLVSRNRSSSLNDLQTNKHASKEKGLIKKSPSLNDLKLAKKYKYPTTPLCLRRTLVKSKAKIKSSEEIELEEIARLQKQLTQHLRYNEISLKKLKLKPRNVNSKDAHIKKEKLQDKENDLKPFLEKLEQKVPRRNLRNLNYDALKKEVMKIDAIINNPNKTKAPEKMKKDNREMIPKNSSTSSKSAFLKPKDSTHVPREYHAIKKIGFHSGLVFHDYVKKNTVLKPFSFDNQVKEVKTKNSIYDKRSASLTNSTPNFNIDAIKENIPQNLVRSTFNQKFTKVLPNQKYGGIPCVKSNKKGIEKCATNKMQSLPLSENVAKN